MRIDALINNGDATTEPILTDTPEFMLYTKLTTSPDEGRSIIGKGEVAAIALASISGGIVASNNLNDVAAYVSELNLRHITTGGILVKALEASFITEDEGNIIWSAMLSKKRKIGAATFIDYINTHR